ncbi:MAG: phenylacetate--CoA ligase family protein [Thermoplasmata archaeon]|nr:phenylacetate--CoA ligase family protein [Thermoplasmata archaeon]MBE3137369.1 phenylacetate--CoA ligase family protein [Thermoplasmata archaeon]MBE3140960.1 phenylacetate--CoA ligase family protein [Thermoplasmata archaeon]
MNSFYNPIFISKVLKNYLFNIDRQRRFNDEELSKYQNKNFKKMVQFAYTVPLYHHTYKKAGIHPDDIKSIEDIKKLPTVSKYDFKNYYPDGLVSSKIKKSKLIEVTTSGTTGKSLSIYVDMAEIVNGLFGYIRFLREHDINWRKDKLTIIGDFAPHTAETGYIYKGIQSQFGKNLFLKNIQWLNTNDPPEKVMEEIDKFKPDFLGGYTGMLGHLALLKEKGFGQDVSPRIIASTGSSLSKSLKEMIERTFNAKVFESYGSTESGPIAFQCRYGKYHIMSDYVYLEFLKDGESVESREAGKVVLTKLFGNGTPIIRYNAMNDIVAPLYEKCNCGLSGVLIDKIYGREDIALYSLDGKILLPSSFGEIFSKILYELKTNKLTDVRVIQHSLTKIEIKVVIDEKLRNVGPSVEELFSFLIRNFKEKLGAGVEIHIKEVDKIDRLKPRIISKVDKTKLNITGYA